MRKFQNNSTDIVNKPMSQPAIQSLTRADEAFDCLQTAIVTGDLAPGEKIGEVELCSRFNLTRGPLREALGRLESRGLLVRRPHAGVKVVSVSADELIELYRIREVMEGLAGLRPATFDRVTLFGEPVQFKRPSDAQQAGLCYLTEDRIGCGIVQRSQDQSFAVVSLLPAKRCLAQTCILTDEYL